jgi:hypothetical protein
MECRSLRSIRLPASLEVIREAASALCKRLADVSFESPSRLSRICDGAFDGCVSLTSITFPTSQGIIHHRKLWRGTLLPGKILP